MRELFDIILQKTETHITRLTVKRNIIYYTGEVSTPTSDLTTMKLEVNSAISYIKSRYMCMDIKYFYLNNQMNRAEYIVIQISMILQEFVDKYNLKDKAQNGYTFARVSNGIYGLPQSGLIAHDSLV